MAIPTVKIWRRTPPWPFLWWSPFQRYSGGIYQTRGVSSLGSSSSLLFTRFPWWLGFSYLFQPSPWGRTHRYRSSRGGLFKLNNHRCASNSLEQQSKQQNTIQGQSFIATSSINFRISFFPTPPSTLQPDPFTNLLWSNLRACNTSNKSLIWDSYCGDRRRKKARAAVNRCTCQNKIKFNVKKPTKKKKKALQNTYRLLRSLSLWPMLL